MALTFVVVLVERLFPQDNATAFRLGNIVLLALSLGIIGSFAILLLQHRVIIPSVRFHKTLARGTITVWQSITQSRWTFKIVLAINMLAILTAVLGILLAGHSLGLFRLPVVEKLPSSVVVRGKPDLSVSQMVLPESAFPGETIDLSFKIENLGTSSSGPFSTQVFFGTVPFETDEPLGTSLVLDSLPVGASGTFTVNGLPIPSSAVSGTYLITVFADSDQLIDEYDEKNNISAALIQLMSIPLPNLLDVGISSENKPWPPQTFLQARPGSKITTWYTFSYSGPNVLFGLKTTVLDSNGKEIGNQLSGSGFQIINPLENPIRVGVEYKLSDDAIPGTYDVKFSIWSEDFAKEYDAVLKQGWLKIASGNVTTTEN